MNKKNESHKKRKNTLNQRLIAANKDNEKIEVTIFMLIFFLFLALCQIIGKVFDIDPLLYMTRTRTRSNSSSTIGFLPVPLGLFLSYIVFRTLKKFSYLTFLVETSKQLSLKLRRYPRVYRLAKFVYRHPLLSYFILVITYIVLETFFIYVIKG